jgi:hypothetical protein
VVCSTGAYSIGSFLLRVRVRDLGLLASPGHLDVYRVGTNDQKIHTVSFRNWLLSVGSDVYFVKIEAMGIEKSILRCALDLLKLGHVKHLMVRVHGEITYLPLVALFDEAGFEIDALSYHPDDGDSRGMLMGTWKGGR